MLITRVTDGVYRSAQPQQAADFEQIKALGIKYILDLETGVTLLGIPDGNPTDEVVIAGRDGIQVMKYPLGEITPPSGKDLSACVIRVINYQPILIHCHTGVDRTGMVVARFRIKVQGWLKADAVREMKQMGMHWWYYWWAFFL